VSQQARDLVQFFADDKKLVRDKAERLMKTVEALSELVNNRRVKNGEEWKELSEDSFFEEAASPFRHFVTMLAAESQSLPEMLHWQPPVVEASEVGKEHDGEGLQEEKRGFLARLVSAPRRMASVTARFLAPPLLEELTPSEITFGVNSLHAEFTRYQAMADEGFLSPKKCREELAEKVGQLIGWIHSDTFRKAAEYVLEVDRISAGVFKEM